MSRRSLVIMLAIAVAALAIDQVSKILIVSALKYPGNSVRVLGDFLTFVLTYNPAGIFGLNIGRGLTYVAFPILGILLVVMFARSSQHAGFAASYGLILGGAFGNLIDRLFRPRGVVDFISFQFFQFRVGDRQIGLDRWFTFNFADTWLIVGILLLLGLELFSGKQSRDKPSPQPAEEMRGEFVNATSRSGTSIMPVHPAQNPRSAEPHETPVSDPGNDKPA